MLPNERVLFQRITPGILIPPDSVEATSEIDASICILGPVLCVDRDKADIHLYAGLCCTGGMISSNTLLLGALEDRSTRASAVIAFHLQASLIDPLHVTNSLLAVLFRDVRLGSVQRTATMSFLAIVRR